MKTQINNLIKDLKNDKKKMIIAIASILIIIIILIVSIIFLMGGNEKKLKKYLEEMGVDFYENLYYPQIGKTTEEKAEFLKDFNEIGIKINLDGLSRYKTEEYKEKIDSFINKKTKEPCDKEKSRVIIYPKEPYGQKDYKLEVELVCSEDEK